MSLTRKQQMIVARVRRAMADAERDGLVTFCDVESWGIRFVPAVDIERDEDPRALGDVAHCSADRVGAPREAGETVHCASQCGTSNPNCPVM